MAAAVPLLIQVGIAAGTYVASSLLAPKPKLNPVDKGRFDDIRVTTAEEGAFIPLCFGERVRLAGNIVWGTVTKEYISRTEGRTGGKGGGGGQQPTPPTNTFSYKKSFAILVCGTPVKSYRRISENLEAIYNNVGSELREDFYEVEHHPLAGGASVVEDGECSGGRAVRLAGSGQYAEVDAWALFPGLHTLTIFYKAAGSAQVFLSANGGAETLVSLPASGSVPVSVTATLSLRRGANTIKLRGGSGTSDVDRIYVSGTGAPPDPGLRPREVTNLINPAALFPVDPDNPTPYYNTVSGFDSSGYFEGFTAAGGQARFELFAGKETQPQSAIIVAVEGASETPAWRDVSYFATEDYLVKEGQLGNFIFEIEPEIQTLDATLEYLYTLDGKVTAADCDFSLVAGRKITGLVLDHRAPLSEWVSALEAWFNFDIVPRGGKITAVPRGGAVVTRLYERELRAHLFGEERPRAAVKITHEDPTDLPGAVDVVYLDPSPSKDFHSGNQTAQKIVGFAFDYETLTFPIVGDPDTAHAVGQRYIDTRHLAAKPGEIVCGFGRRYLIPTDVVEVEMEDGTLYTYRLGQKQAALQGLVKFAVVPERASVYTQGGAGVVGRGGDVLVIRPPANTLLVVLDCPPFRQEDIGRLVGVAAGCPRGAGSWVGYHLNKKDLNGETEWVGSSDQPATIGVVETASQSTARSGLEATREFVVKLYYGSLESRTEAEARGERVNLAFYGKGNRWEAMQFLTVEPQTPSAPFVAQYKVTGVVSGLFGTEGQSANHQAGDYFVLVDPAVWSFPMRETDVTRTFDFIGQTAGQSFADAEAVGSYTFTFQGNSRKPLAPARVELDADTGLAPRDSAGSILVEAWPRTGADVLGDEYLLECLTDDRSAVVFPVEFKEGDPSPALLESDSASGKYAAVTANTLRGQLAVSTQPRIINARAYQRIRQAGNTVDATLEVKAGGDDPSFENVASLCLMQPAVGWHGLFEVPDTSVSIETGQANGKNTDFVLRMEAVQIGVAPFVKYEVAAFAGSTLLGYTDSLLTPTLTNRARVRVELAPGEVRFYWTQPGQSFDEGAVPFARSTVPVNYPLAVLAQARTTNDYVRDIMVTTNPLPSVVITAAQQQRFYGPLKKPLQVSVRQHSGVREVGYGPAWEGAI